MLETPHVAVGAAIASKVVHPALAIPLAFGSHFVLDMIPHWNPHLNSETKRFGHPAKTSTRIVILDIVASLAIGGFIAYRALPNTILSLTILVSAFFSVLPDVIEGPYFFLKMRGSEFIKKWIAFQKSIQSDATLIPSLVTQTLTILAALWWALA